MTARAYTTTLSRSESWEEPGLEILSIPVPFVGGFTVGDFVGGLGLDADFRLDFGNIEEVREVLVGHFSAAPGLAELVLEVFEQPVAVVEESPGRAKAMSAVAGAGAIAAGFAVFGPWAVIALPVGVFLLAAAPEAGEGVGFFVGSWLRKRAPR